MQYKYIMNMGLAFDEERAMKKLSEMAREGWILKEMSLFRYKLVQGEPKELIYSVDYKKVKKDDKEYFQLFEGSNWRHMCSYGPFHFFSAEPGTVPLYTDKETYRSKYAETKNTYLKALIISLITLFLSVLMQMNIGIELYHTPVFDILFIVGIISAMIAAPSLMVYVAFLMRERKKKFQKEEI